MPNTGLPPGNPCQDPSFLWSPPALKQATRAFRLAGDRIAIGARGLSWEAGPTAVWSCLPLRRMAESSAANFTVGKIQKDSGQRVAKMYGQQKRNIIHTSSTAYEQDHSAAAPLSSEMNSHRFIRSPRRRGR